MPVITHARLLEVLRYDPLTGIFNWRIQGIGGITAGDVAGSSDPRGYQHIFIDRKKYRSHRLAWFYMHGIWVDQIDHKDTNCSNNRLDNLRPATRSENAQNRRKPYANSTSGFLGVSKIKRTGRWTAQIMVNGMARHLGCSFRTPEDAYAAYVAAKVKLHPFQTLVPT